MRRKWWGLSAIAMILAIWLVMIPIIFKSEDSAGWSLPLSGQVVVLDPGHGGVDGGAGSKAGLLEKEVSLDIALALRDYIQEAGGLVIMTRETDKDLAQQGTSKVRTRKVEDLKERVRVINTSNADMFISLHLNAIAASRWNGAQTFYNRAIEQNEGIAKHIQHELVRNLENTTRKAKPINNVYLIKNAQIPGALVEVGFLSNPPEAELLSTKEYQEKVAASIYEGLLRYANKEPLPE